MNRIEPVLQDILEPYAPAIEAEIRALVDEPPNPQHARLYGMLAYHLGWVEPNRGPVGMQMQEQTTPDPD